MPPLPQYTLIKKLKEDKVSPRGKKLDTQGNFSLSWKDTEVIIEMLVE